MKRILSILLALMLCLAPFGCRKEDTNQSGVDADPLPGEQVAPEVPEVIFGNYSATFGDSSGTIDYVLVDANLPHVESLPQIHSYYQTLWEDLKAIYGLSREDAARQRTEYQAMGLEFIPWTVELEFEVTRNDGVTLSVLREVYENLGGAHPMITYRAETFDVASQGRLLLGDLFSVAEDAYSARLQDMILAQMDQKETETGVLYYESAREQLMPLLDPMDFALTEDCLRIFYNEYALAPHAAGPQHFYLPLSDLSDIVIPQYLTE